MPSKINDLGRDIIGRRKNHSFSICFCYLFWSKIRRKIQEHLMEIVNRLGDKKRNDEDWNASSDGPRGSIKFWEMKLNKAKYAFEFEEVKE